MADIEVVRAIVLGVGEHEGSVLLVEKSGAAHDNGMLQFPGGKIDAGETPTEAMVREVWEETNLPLRVLKKPELAHSRPLTRGNADGDYNVRLGICVAQHCRVYLCSESSASRWVPAERLDTLPNLSGDNAQAYRTFGAAVVQNLIYSMNESSLAFN
jgi:8-oxo-dGTP pyrophosphatase MutT (NUDIX family)